MYGIWHVDNIFDTGKIVLNVRYLKIPLSYAQAFASELVTAADIDRHEARIYKEGRTPAAIRSSIKLSLRAGLPEQHLKEFDSHDIPPSTIDAQTHMVLQALLLERNKCPNRDPPSQAHNETNRVMYQIFSDSRFPIRDNNFALYCKLHLRNLPAKTAVELQTIRAKLDRDEPPYRPIQLDALPDPTVPTFSQASNKQPMPVALKPRQQWMRDTLPSCPMRTQTTLTTLLVPGCSARNNQRQSTTPVTHAILATPSTLWP
jgi:hypothetical protein